MDAKTVLPTRSSSTATRRGKHFLPLSSHGMPKTPHHFSSLRSPPLSPDSDRYSLNSPLMSPPMSARSFNTFIESEPSTPAFSPRAPSSDWDGSTLVLLSPVKSEFQSPSLLSPIQSESPVEPEWEMMAPVRKLSASGSSGKRDSTNIVPSTSLSSHPPIPLPLSQPDKSIPRSEKEKKKEIVDPSETDLETTAARSDAPTQEDDAPTNPTAPLGKLALRMKSMLRRKTVSEKKNESRRRVKEDLDRMEEVHWTEM
ncbi:hypothetical protein GQ43DRAFT_437125 [Delitschia confertaspora ATCC 74209]|uniref:Uncharacterized protein n=1 Tax=Delitschia confertaspora ATCC 74209 TaxID=1513339 RepID=A0A9P4JY22_9PLEO|nr:hypothetical protein GQ43DRAFT_437125 [Delitschia confertaspora ATCC 74209]